MVGTANSLLSKHTSVKVANMNLSDNRINKFLFAAEAVGIVFVGLFCAAYLLGLPTTNVLHSEPFLRIPLNIFGVVLLILVLMGCVLAVLPKKK